ncbi:MAG: type 4a pilus biogenesis protein PilO [Bacteriovoracaceae bacterium]
MRDLSAKLAANLHIFIFLYMLYNVWVAWDEHSIAVEEMNGQLEAAVTNISVNQKRLGEIQEFVKKRDEYQLRVEEVAKNIEAVQKQLPPTTNDSEIISFLNQELTNLNIKESNMRPGSENQSMYFISKDYQMTAKGTFLQFLVFFERIGNAPRIYNVPELSLKVMSGGKKGRFQMIEAASSIQAYRFNPSFKVDRGFPTEEGGQ